MKLITLVLIAVIIHYGIDILRNYPIIGYASTTTTYSTIKLKLGKNNNYFKKINIDEYNNKVNFIVSSNITDENYQYIIKISKHSDFGKKLESIIQDHNSTSDIVYLDSPPIYSKIVDYVMYLCVCYIIIYIIIFAKTYFNSGESDITNNIITNSILSDTKTIYQVIKKTDIKFSDVIGQQKAKEDLKECIKYFKSINN